MSILIGADIVPTEANKEYFASGNMKPVIGDDLETLLKQADYRIFNLETPLTDVDTPIEKGGPTLRANVTSINGIKAIEADLLTIANNHIMDHGNAGLESTIETFNRENISFLGAGKNLVEASRPFSFDYNGKIAVYACAEHEFSIAEKDKPGANPFDPLESFDHVSGLKKKNDFVIVLYHGGKERYRYPSPMLQRVCRKFVEKGADLVVCQHSHCIGCEEKYIDGTIVYGQGNFIFNTCDGPTEQTSLLVKIDGRMKVSYIPLVKYANGVRLASGENAEKIMREFHNRSENISRENFIETEYNKFARQNLARYLLTCSGYYRDFFKRFFDKISGYRLSSYLAKKSYCKKDLLAIQNFIECEAHRELWIEGLKHE